MNKERLAAFDRCRFVSLFQCGSLDDTFQACGRSQSLVCFGYYTFITTRPVIANNAGIITLSWRMLVLVKQWLKFCKSVKVSFMSGCVWTKLLLGG
jgi:hypothetical protein